MLLKTNLKIYSTAALQLSHRRHGKSTPLKSRLEAALADQPEHGLVSINRSGR